MTRTTGTVDRAVTSRPSVPGLMMCTMTAQALLVVLTGSVAAVAADLHVDAIAVTQARTITAAAALVAAVVLMAKVAVLGVARLAVGGSLLAVASGAAVATARGLPHFLVAHVVVGVAAAALLTAGYAGLASWPRAERRSAAGWVTAAAGIAWVVGAPAVGLLSEHVSWRAAALLPAIFACGALALSRLLAVPAVAVVRHGALASLLRRRDAIKWILMETIAHIAWASVLTFSGAFFILELGIGDGLTGILLSIGAACFVVASIGGRRLGRGLDPRRLVATLTVLFAVGVLVLFSAALLRPGSLASATLGTVGFAVAAALAGLRIPASADLGMAQHPERPDVVMASRTLCQHAGYLLGSVLSGVTVAMAGWTALGPVLAVVLVGSAILSLRLAWDGDGEKH